MLIKHQKNEEQTTNKNKVNAKQTPNKRQKILNKYQSSKKKLDAIESVRQLQKCVKLNFRVAQPSCRQLRIP